MINCPNCGAPIEPYKCKCDFCGSWYFDLTAFDMSDDKPYYIKFRTPDGVITTLAQPELRSIDVYEEPMYAIDHCGTILQEFVKNRECDMSVVFHSILDKSGRLFTLETRE